MIINNLLKNRKSKHYGYDVAKGKYCNMMDSGIIDPLKVVKLALQNAVAVASLMLTTECMVVNEEDVKGNEEMP